MTKFAWKIIGFSAALGIYALILWSSLLFDPKIGTASTSFLWLVFLGFCLCLLTLAMVQLPIRDWLLLIVIFIPFERSSPISVLPSFSPIDYFCAAAIVAWTIKHWFRRIFTTVIQSLGYLGTLCWLCFVLFGLFDAYKASGHSRNVWRWGEFIFAYILAHSVPFNERQELGKKVASLLQWLGVVLSIGAIIQFIASFGDYMQAYATFGQHNGFAAFLLFCLPASFGLLRLSESRERDQYYIAVIIIFIGFLISFSRGAWFGLLGGCLVAWFFSKPKSTNHFQFDRRFVLITAVLSILILTLQFFGPHSGHTFKDSGRINYIMTGLRIIKDKPLFGLGPGNYENQLHYYLNGSDLDTYYKQLSLEHRLDYWQHLHNIYLQITVIYGLVGFGFWAIGLFYLVSKTAKSGYGMSGETNPMRYFFFISIYAFLIHNIVDILFVSSMDLLFMFLLVLAEDHTRSSSFLSEGC